MLEFILDPIFMPLINIDPPILPIALISFGITLFITVIYKYTTDQETMTRLKKDMKNSQAEMKKHKDNPQKMMEMQKKAMEKNMEYMKHSMKSTLFTMLPIIIIFGYLNVHMGFMPIMPGEEFTTTVEFVEGTDGEIELFADNLEILSGSTQEIENDVANFELRGDEGIYQLEYEYDGKTYSQELLITTDRTYRKPIMPVKRSDVKKLIINNEKVIALNLFGWKLGWLGSYIILSILFSTVIRKLMKVA